MRRGNGRTLKRFGTLARLCAFQNDVVAHHNPPVRGCYRQLLPAGPAETFLRVARDSARVSRKCEGGSLRRGCQEVLERALGPRIRETIQECGRKIALTKGSDSSSTPAAMRRSACMAALCIQRWRDRPLRSLHRDGDFIARTRQIVEAHWHAGSWRKTTRQAEVDLVVARISRSVAEV